MPRTSAPQTPCTEAPQGTLGKASDATSLALTDAADTSGTAEERIARLEAQNKQLLDSHADLMAMVRKTVETGVIAAPVKLPTVEEAQGAGHTQPVLTQTGWLVPDSDKWAVSRGDTTRK